MDAMNPVRKLLTQIRRSPSCPDFSIPYISGRIRAGCIWVAARWRVGLTAVYAIHLQTALGTHSAMRTTAFRSRVTSVTGLLPSPVTELGADAMKAVALTSRSGRIPTFLLIRHCSKPLIHLALLGHFPEHTAFLAFSTKAVSRWHITCNTPLQTRRTMLTSIAQCTGGGRSRSGGVGSVSVTHSHAVSKEHDYG
jgi:hypothetical protein